MIGRRQLAVASPVSLGALLRAALDSVLHASRAEATAASLLRERYQPAAALLTDSGTSALVTALRVAVPRGGTVGFPGYACVDLAAAARYAGVRVRLYDIDPHSLSADLDSVKRMMQRGVDAIVVAHLFGYAADVPAVRDLASTYGVAVIEDAAQGAGGTLAGRRLGSFGDLSVLSFGRGKGLCAGGGGALLAADATWAGALNDVELEARGGGWGSLASTGAQWVLGRPSVYAIPSMVPWLHLGEMVYHPASEPRALSRTSSALLESAFAMEADDVAQRRARARSLDEIVRGVADADVIDPIPGSNPGYLRYAVRLTGARPPGLALGIVQPYPRTLAEQPELAPVLVGSEPATPGSTQLRESLFALPTHRFVTDSDVRALGAWLRSGRAR